MARRDLHLAGELVAAGRDLTAGGDLLDYPESALFLASAARVANAQGNAAQARSDAARAERLLPALNHAVPWLAVQARLELGLIDARQEQPAAVPARPGSSCLGDVPATLRALTALRVSDYRLILRRLSLRDDCYIQALLAEGNDDARCPELSASAHALVRLGALIAVDAAPASYMSAIEDARRAGVTTDQIVTTLIAVLPVVGVPRVVSAAPNLSLALGYDIADALEVADPQGS